MDPRWKWEVRKKKSLWANSWTATVREKGVIWLDVGEGGFCMVDRSRKLSLSWREGQQVYLTVSEREKFHRNAEPLACNPAVVSFFSPQQDKPKLFYFLFFYCHPLNRLLPHIFLKIFCEPGSSSGMRPEEEMRFLQLLWNLQWRFAHASFVGWKLQYTPPQPTYIMLFTSVWLFDFCTSIFIKAAHAL